MGYTVEDFLHVFERYNEAIWPMQVVAYALAVAVVALALSKARWAGRAIFSILAGLWALMGVGYMWLYFSDINGLAYPFGALFVAQAVLLVFAAVRERPGVFGALGGVRAAVGALLILYATLAYPLIGVALGHSYPKAPMFGVAPCPTTIFTLGILLLSARPRRMLFWLPFVWSLIGFFAAVKLGIREDIGLLVAGLVTAGLVLRRDRPAQGEPAPAGEVARGGGAP